MTRERERGLGRIFRRRDRAGKEYGAWVVAYCFRGKEYRESTGSSDRGVARRLLKQRLGEVARGRVVGPRVERVAVKELLDDLVVDYRIKQRASLRTVEAHVEALLGHLEPARAVDVTTARLNRIVEAWQAEGVASATINKRMATLRRAFTLGRESEPPKVTIVPRFPRLPEHNAREGFFDKAEFFGVLGALPDDGLRDFCEWAFWTGMRKGELGRLEWAAFDRETWTLTLPGRITKNRRARKLVLTGPLRTIIERRLAIRRLDCRLIFHRDGEAIREFRKAWKTACKKAGLAAGKGGRLFHDLRRTGVRNLRRAGADRRVAMAISGHRTESVFERYNIDTDDDLREAIEKVATYVDALPSSAKVVPLAVGQ